MRALQPILALFWQTHRRALLLGLGLSCLTLACGAALLGLAGWFIAASAAAGAVGAGLSFDFFRPSAAIRFLALGRAAARYGERLTTHDATLRFLAALRARLFRAIAGRPFPALARLRRAVVLNRLTADVDALDALWLRLVVPAAAGALVLALAALALWWIDGLVVALWVSGVIAASGVAAAYAGIRFGSRAARQRGLALEAVRVRLVDLADGAVELALAGRLRRQEAAVARADAAAAKAGARLDRLDRLTAPVLEIGVALAAAGALALSAALGLDTALAALAVLAALALGETVAPLRRGALEAGRILLAARRIAPALAEPVAAPAPTAPEPVPTAPALMLEAVAWRWPGATAPALLRFSLTVSPGEWVALTGPSGCGKSTALALAGGLIAPDAGVVRAFGHPLRSWPETALRARVAMLPQRSALFAGSIAEALRLADPDARDADLHAALAAVALDAVVDRLGGLDAPLGEGGAGLSGGEARRLALARIVLRRPSLALLDEPTEGLDPATAAQVLTGLQDALGDAAVVMASHRAEELAAADRLVRLHRATAEAPMASAAAR
jgi:ATP-binding cassette subfamily C protein CydC